MHSENPMEREATEKYNLFEDGERTVASRDHSLTPTKIEHIHTPTYQKPRGGWAPISFSKEAPRDVVDALC